MNNPVTHGGCWNDYAEDFRSGIGYRFKPSFRYYSIGFRVVKGKPPTKNAIRGGCWDNDSLFLSSSFRVDSIPAFESSFGIGFRVVKGKPPAKRVSRGGSWYSNAECCRSAYRDRIKPSYRHDDYGFRVVKETSESVYRGGSWLDPAGNCEASLRGRLDPSFRDDYFGFRVVKTFTSNNKQKERLGMNNLIKTIRIPAGTDIKGNNVEPFEMGETPVTEQQWVSVMGSLPERQLELKKPYEPNRPVVEVSHEDATAFCKRLSEQTGETYRLPTEQEWEYACRAGTTGKFSCPESELADHAVYDQESITDVKTKKPNPWGLYDMHGLVWEWCR